MPALRFSKAQQLTHDREYQRVYAARTSVNRGPLRIYGVTNDLGRTRIGLSVPKRIGTNVKRNRLKRLIREAYRTARVAAPSCGLDLVVNVHPHDELTLAEYGAMLQSAADALTTTWAARNGQGAKGQTAN